MKAKPVFIGSLCLLLFCGVVKSQTEIEKKFYGNSKYKNGYGVVLCSISRVKMKPYYNEYILNLENYQTGKKKSLHKNTTLLSGAPASDYENDSLQVYLTAEIVPVGKYKVSNYHLSNGGEIYSCKDDFEIPFEVTENKISYIGEFLCVPMRVKILGIKRPWGGFFIASDKFVRDSSLIANKFKEFDFKNIIDLTPKSLIYNSGCIAIKSDSF